MVRPKKKVVRNFEIRVRVTDIEREKLVAKAAKSGKTLADYVRAALKLDEENYGQK